MCHDPQIFLVQIISLCLQTCHNYGATMIWSGQSNYRDGLPIYEATQCAGVMQNSRDVE